MWHSAGVSTIPIRANGTKRPVVEWATYQARIPELGDLERWWGNGHEYGLAVICGAVSGNLEMAELEGAVALNTDLMVRIDQIAEEKGLTYIWEGLRQTYSEWTPSGGIHLLYRISDHPVPGNEKIARDAEGKVRAETRGEGGYVIVAPTSGLCHPSGESWNLLENSSPGVTPLISWEERQALHEVLRLALDEAPAPSKALVVPPQVNADRAVVGPRPEGAGDRPGDEYAARMSWADILEPVGWTLSHRQGVEEFWVRPGKNRRDGHSATTNYEGSDLLKMFSSSVAELDADATYTKFGAYTHLWHRGDFKEAAKTLARQGFGASYISPRTGDAEIATIEDGESYTLDDVGNGQRMLAQPACYYPDHRIADVHRWVSEEKRARAWDGTVWTANENAILWETDCITLRMMRSGDSEIAKQGSKARSAGKQAAMAKFFFSQPGMTVSASEFDQESRWLNLENGVYDLQTGQLYPHDPMYMITRKFGACYDPDARAHQWEKFLEQALPDKEMRDYVQRCLGYTLLGNPSERAMFVVYGPSGTGKSTFLETLNAIFGDYGETAPSGTFRESRSSDDTAATPALHGLKGKRFVTTSETSEGVRWNEELVKRYTGRDMMRSRGLYETFQTWRNEASIWLATNHAPRFTTDDRAIWNRVKLIPFETVFLGEGQVRAMDEILAKEADGILLWLLEGLTEYRRHGLAEPAQVTASVRALREQSDSVIKFLDDRAAVGELVFAADQAMNTRDLYTMYSNWCRSVGERPLGATRFAVRLDAADRGLTQLGPLRWGGVGRIPGSWLVAS
jgi:putative DNA primase/helicase